MGIEGDPSKVWAEARRYLIAHDGAETASCDRVDGKSIITVVKDGAPVPEGAAEAGPVCREKWIWDSVNARARKDPKDYAP